MQHFLPFQGRCHKVTDRWVLGFLKDIQKKAQKRTATHHSDNRIDRLSVKPLNTY